jgi:hypothetical protein
VPNTASMRKAEISRLCDLKKESSSRFTDDNSYRVGQRIFSIVKQALLDHSLLKFIQSNMNWKTNLQLYWGTSQWSDFYKPHPSELSNASDALTNSLHNTFHYADTTGDMAFLFQKFLARDCVRLSNMSETLFFSKRPIKRKPKPTDLGGGGRTGWPRNVARNFVIFVNFS